MFCGVDYPRMRGVPGTRRGARHGESSARAPYSARFVLVRSVLARCVLARLVLAHFVLDAVRPR
eukprot:7318517-Lingulodinium_polyedra.AAC.1